MSLDLEHLDNPRPLLDAPLDELYSAPSGAVDAFRLRAAKALFDKMRPGIAFLDRLARNQGVDRVESLDDIAPLLFVHTTYKSYPLSLLERGDFPRLTKWLGQLTTHDLSRIDFSAISSIEDWLLALDTQTPLRIVTTSATSGKLSFLPRSTAEMPVFHAAYRHLFLPFANEPGVDIMAEEMPILHFGYERGFSSMGRRLASLTEFLPGVGERTYAMYPGRLSPDVLSLAGRLAGAEARGDRSRASVGEALLARREEFIRFQKERPTYIRKFVERLESELAGRRVLVVGGMSSIIDAALEAEQLGVSGLFAPDSVLVAGGGLKGRPDTPDDYEDRIMRFMGVSGFHDLYGMTEQTAFMHKCPSGHYHVPPYLVPFVLDPDSGQPLPRRGAVTGRFAFLDLFPHTYWGGFVSGDAVTIHWDGGCACGRTGSYLDGSVRRYSELRGGDDRISCAGTPAAYDRALEYLIGSL